MTAAASQAFYQLWNCLPYIAPQRSFSFRTTALRLAVFFFAPSRAPSCYATKVVLCTLLISIAKHFLMPKMSSSTQLYILRGVFLLRFHIYVVFRPLRPNIWNNTLPDIPFRLQRSSAWPTYFQNQKMFSRHWLISPSVSDHFLVSTVSDAACYCRNDPLKRYPFSGLRSIFLFGSRSVRCGLLYLDCPQFWILEIVSPSF